MARAGLRLGRLPAHDAAKADRARIVADAQHRAVDLDLLPVEQQHFLALSAPAHVDRALQLVHVVDVQRPAQFEHHVVGHVHQRRDRALAGALQAPAHPLRRRRRGVDVADYPPGKAAAAFGMGDLEGVPGFDFLGYGFDLGGIQFSPCQCGNFPGNTQYRQTIGSVRRQLEGQHPLVQRERLAHIRAGFRVRGQLEQPGAIVREPEFLCRAQHASALYASQVCLFDIDSGQFRTHSRQGRHHADPNIRRAANHPEFFLADIDRADGQLVRIRVFLHRQHFSDHDTRERRRDRRAGLHFQPRHGEQMGKLVDGNPEIDEAAKPVFRNDHENWRRKRRSPSKNSRRSSMP